MKFRPDRLLAEDRIFYLALFLLLSTIVASLFYISFQWKQESDLIPLTIAAHFDTEKLDSELPANLIDYLDAYEAQCRRDFTSFQALSVTLIRGEREILVYPPFTEGLPPRSHRAIPLIKNGREIARLYVDFNDRRVVLLTACSWGAAGISILVFLVVLFRGRRQERRIHETRVELARKQEELIRLERLALIGQMTAGILHDLKKPVLNIRDEAENLGESNPAREIRDQTDLFFQILREADVESFVRRESGRKEYLEPAEIIRKSVNLVRYESDGAVFQIDIAEDLPLILGIRHRLIQVFSNLFLNALQATGGKGEIRVTAVVTTAGERRWLDFAIGDNGPGIPANIREHIFEPLFSGGRGTGLGLYIVRSIVEEMGGRIEVRSQEKHGTTFILSFPIPIDEDPSGR